MTVEVWDELYTAKLSLYINAKLLSPWDYIETKVSIGGRIYRTRFHRSNSCIAENTIEIGDTHMAEEKSKTLTWGTVLKGVVVVLGLLLTLWALQSHLESTIRGIVNNEEFIRKVASHVRPYIIFDANEAIHVDGGAMQYLEDISVQKSKPWDTGAHLQIVITPKEHLSYAPLLDYLSSGRFILRPTPNRGRGHRWIYEFDVVHWEEDAGKPMLFRLEIIP